MRAYGAAGLGAVLGFVAWMSSPTLTGKLEPWDAGSRTFLIVLVALGALLGWRVPEAFWAGPLGLYLGQALAISGRYTAGALGDRAYPFPLPLLFLVSYTLPAFLAAAGTAGLRTWWSAGRPGGGGTERSEGPGEG